MDLKHITKAELYRQLCEERKRSAEYESKINGMIVKTNVENVRMKNELQTAKEKIGELEELVEKQAEYAHKQTDYISELQEEVALLEEYRADYLWCVRHPWKNLLGMEVQRDE